MTIVTYHYVRDKRGADCPGIKGLTKKEFASQLNYLKNNYTVVSLEDYLTFLKGEKDIADNACILTFDDGFRDHYDNVFPLLKQSGLLAAFFPLTQPLTEFRAAAVHKAHFLLAKLGTKAFADEFNQTLKKKFPELVKEFFVEAKQKQEKKYRWEDNLTANLKYNIAIMPALPKNKILNQLFAQYFKDEKAFSQNLYFGFKEMKEMLKAGMSFGAHSHTHPMLSKLKDKEQKQELKASKEILEKALQTKIISFSYPYGDFNKQTIVLLKELGYCCALTIDAGVNKTRAGIDPFTLKRFDTKDLPFN